MGNSIIMYDDLSEHNKNGLLSIIKKYYASKSRLLQIKFSIHYYIKIDDEYKECFNSKRVCFKNINELSKFLDLLNTPYVIADNCYDRDLRIGCVLWVQNLKDSSQLNYENELKQLNLRLDKMERELVELRSQQNYAMPVAYVEQIIPSAPPPENIILTTPTRRLFIGGNAKVSDFNM